MEKRNLRTLIGKVYFSVSVSLVLLGFFLLSTGSNLLSHRGLQWRTPALQAMIEVTAGAMILLLIGAALRLFLNNSAGKGRRILRCILGAFCIYLCLGVFVAGAMGAASAENGDVTREISGKQYIIREDSSGEELRSLCHGPFLMEKNFQKYSRTAP